MAGNTTGSDGTGSFRFQFYRQVSKQHPYDPMQPGLEPGDEVSSVFAPFSYMWWTGSGRIISSFFFRDHHLRINTQSIGPILPEES